MPYLDTPNWARNVLNMIYSGFYVWSAVSAVNVIAYYGHAWLDVSMSLSVLACILAVYSLWRRASDWEWAATLFILGGIITYLGVQWYEVFTGATESRLVLDASTGAGALFLLSARSVLLYIAVQKNKMYAQHMRE